MMMMMMMMMKWIMEELLLDDIKVCLRHFYSDRNQHWKRDGEVPIARWLDGKLLLHLWDIGILFQHV